jgi:hypothetical protein
VPDGTTLGRDIRAGMDRAPLLRPGVRMTHEGLQVIAGGAGTPLVRVIDGSGAPYELALAEHPDRGIEGRHGDGRLAA